MNRTDIVKRAGRNLRQAKGRTLLTSLAIAVGAFTMTLSLAAGEGARQYAADLLKSNIDPQALYITKDSDTANNGGSMKLQEYSEDNGSGYRPGSTMKMMTKDDVIKLQARSDIKEVVPFYNLAPMYASFEGSAKKYSASIDYYDSTVVSEATVGTLPKLGVQISDEQILIPEEYAADLGITPKDFLGKKVSVTFAQTSRNPTEAEIQQAMVVGGQDAVTDLMKPQTKTYTFTVSAVVKKPAMAIMSNPRMRISTNMAKQINEFASVNSKNGEQFMAVTAIAKGDAKKVKESITKDYKLEVQTAEEAQGALFTFVNTLQGIVAGFATLALIASVFGIINTQYISVLERTSQIGLMKALGMSRRGVARMFRYEAAWIGFLGGALGALLAMLLGWLMNPTITKTLGLGNNSLLIFVWWQVLSMIVALVVIAVLAGWFPARKAAKLDPIEALRTE